MKVLSVQEASVRLDSICKEALAGEIIRLELPNGSLLELLPLAQVPTVRPLTEQELAGAYDDPEWAKFENQCGAASQ